MPTPAVPLYWAHVKTCTGRQLAFSDENIRQAHSCKRWLRAETSDLRTNLAEAIYERQWMIKGRGECNWGDWSQNQMGSALSVQATLTGLGTREPASKVFLRSAQLIQQGSKALVWMLTWQEIWQTSSLGRQPWRRPLSITSCLIMDRGLASSEP